MISLANIKLKLSSIEDTNDSAEFLEIHRNIEAYIKRVLLISLRLNGIKYKESTTIVESTYLNTANLIEKVLFLLDSSELNQRQVLMKLREKYNKFFVLKELVLKFTSKYRNRLAHGTISELKDQELISCLCFVNKLFYREFESMLNIEYGKSAFDKPCEWGAENGMDEEIDSSAKRLGLGKILEEPLSLKVVKSRLSKI